MVEVEAPPPPPPAAAQWGGGEGARTKKKKLVDRSGSRSDMPIICPENAPPWRYDRGWRFKSSLQKKGRTSADSTAFTLFLTHLVHIHVDMSQLQIDFFLHQTYYTLCRNGLQAAAVPIVLITDNSRW